MQISAVLYISPKLMSNSTVYALEEVGGVPVATHLFHRLQQHLPKDQLTCYVLYHEGSLAKTAESALQKVPANIVKTTSRFRQPAFAALLKDYPDIKTLALFPEGSIFPNVNLMREMARLHNKYGAEVTYTKIFPDGLLPVFYSRAGLSRLFSFGWPDEGTLPMTELLEKANQIAPEDKFRFHLRTLSVDEFSERPVLEKLPASLTLQHRNTLLAAAQVLQNQAAATLPGSEAAYAFKDALLAIEERPPVYSVRPAPAQAPTVLYASAMGGFTGAEMCFYDLITQMDRTRYQPVALLATAGTLAEKLAGAGIDTEVGRFDFSQLSEWDLRFFREFLTQWKVRLVHVNGWGNLPLLVAAQQAGVPIVYHARTLDGRRTSHEAKFATRIIAISKCVADDLLKADLDPKKITQIYDGQDTENFRPGRYERATMRRQQGLDTKIPIVLFIARLTPQKRVDYFIEAVAQVKKKVEKFQALIVGEGSPQDAAYIDSLKSMVKKLKLENEIFFWGFEPDIVKIHSMVNVLANCTLDEPLGHSLQEAMACATPVVAPNRAGPSELIHDDIDGLLYDPSKPEFLADALARVLVDPALQERLGHGARDAAVRLDVRRHAREVADLYDGLLKK